MDLSVSDASVGRLLDGRYRLDALLARGGMATVYRATDTRLDRAVALKVMHAELAADNGAVARFIGEARAVARLSHPHVVNVFDQGEDDGAVFLTMEFIDGRTLRDVLNERGRLSAPLALEVIESVLSALAAAHAAGIVHRDVKPENVLVGYDGRVKVADFGLARGLSSSNKTTGGLLGTVSYISPEQALGERATPRSDVYSTGIMLYELLTGQTPHTGPTDFVVVRSHIDQDVPPPSHLVPLPTAVDDLVLTATARDPELRYPDAGQFLVATRMAIASSGGARRIEQADSDPRYVDALATAAPEPVPAPPVEPPPASTRVIETPPVPPPPPPGMRSGTSAPGRGGRRAARTQASASADRRSRRGMAMFLAVLLLVVGVAGAAWWYGLGRWTATPSLLNLTPEEASEVVAEAGLTARAAGEEFSETVEPGLILSTEPGPGEQVLKGGQIAFVVSKGPERYEVPEVVGMAVDQATQALADVSLRAQVADEVYDETVPEGMVISQAVEPGTLAKRDAEVALVVSLGREPIEVTDFTGRSANEAREALSAAGFDVAVTEQQSDTVAAGVVISQEPSTGTAFRGDEVRLVVSTGPELIELPNVVGEKVQKAERELTERGFAVEIVDMIEQFRGRDSDRVVRMDPGPGTYPRGTTVTLYHF